MKTNLRGSPPTFDVDKWLENLLLDEHRAAYSAMTPDQKMCVHFAYSSGFLTGVNKHDLYDIK